MSATAPRRFTPHVLRAHGAEIIDAIGSPASLVELGSGDSRKTRLLRR